MLAEGLRFSICSKKFIWTKLYDAHTVCFRAHKTLGYMMLFWTVVHVGSAFLPLLHRKFVLTDVSALLDP